MRTKALLCAAALAAGVVSSMAQSNVYSLNVVGYVNTSFAGGFNLVNNPLNAPDNHLGQIMKGANVPDNTSVFLWDTTAQDFSGTVPTYVAATQIWVPDAIVNPGTGIFVLAPAPYTNTFVGDVKQGVTAIPVNGGFNAIASAAPIGGDINTVFAGIPANDNDSAFNWDTTTQDFASPSTYVLATQTWVPAMNIGVGAGVFYLNAGANFVWNQSFTVAP